MTVLMKTGVSIIIVNYNCAEHTCNCIASIYKYCLGTSFEIIVVDNASAGDFVNVITERFPDVKLIVNGKNLGFGVANNIGVRVALGKYLFFLNPDTILLSNAVSEFYSFLENSGAEVGCCGCNLVTLDGKPNTSFGNFPSVLQQFSDIGFRSLYKRYYNEKLTMAKRCDFNEVIIVDYLVGAAVFIKKQIFEAIGGFDEGFFMYYEETDLFFRLNKAGYKSYILPKIKIIHLEGITTESEAAFNYERWVMMEKSRYYYFTKNKGVFTSICVRLVQLLSLTLLYCFGKTPVNLKKAIWITLKA
jgi:GT2 family glycosyltransferase